MPFGSTGARFSFGAFLKLITRELVCGREERSLVFVLTVILAGQLRPIVRDLADRTTALSAALVREASSD